MTAQFSFGDFDIPSLLSPADEKVFEPKSIGSRPRSSSSMEEDERKDLSEEERKRIRNTAAARRCREKIRKRTEELESALHDLQQHNIIKHRQRIILLSQIRHQIENLKIIVRLDPSKYNNASRDSMMIVNEYVLSVRSQRRKIDEQYLKDDTF